MDIQYFVSLITQNKSIIFTAIVILIYLFYYSKCSFYNFVQSWQPGDGKKKHGNALPSYPNGWIRLCNSKDLKKGQSRFFKHNGRHVVGFRAFDGTVYCLDAYCPHMGANLGNHGKVINNDCIQCPFHGWVFEGKSGKVVQEKTKQPRKIVQYEYNNGVDNPQPAKNDEFLIQCHEGEYKQKTYKVIEQDQIILVWFHNISQDEPLWYPFKLDPKLQHRGTSKFTVNCHIQDLAENLVDAGHFPYIHKCLFNFVTFITYHYSMKNMYAGDPNLLKFMQHQNSNINKKIQNILRTNINDDNKKYISVISIDIKLSIFGLKPFFAYNLVFLQFGLTQAFLFLNTPWFQSQVMQLNLCHTEKYMLFIVGNIYAPSSVPYFVSAFLIKELYSQVNTDAQIVQNKKIFGEKIAYIKDNLNDERLKSWRNWAAKFYEGSAEFERKMDKFEW